MTTFEDSRRFILSHARPLGTEQISLFDTAGRVLSQEVTAPCDMPSYDKSAMDGFAVRAEDCCGNTCLTITGYLPAGKSAEGVCVEKGTAVRILTGAPVPKGADAVIPIEDTEQDGDKLFIKSKITVGKHILFQGKDVARGESILPVGTLLRPSEISMLASFNQVKVPVFRRARVAILATGDELVEPGHVPGPGQIVNSNALSLVAALKEINAEPVLLGIARDDKESLRQKILEGLKADALITSAGISMGDRDYVADVLKEIGADPVFWKVEVKPGGPTAFNMCGAIPVFSLPGNPVSTLISFEELVRPALLRMMGHRKIFRPLSKVVLAEDVQKKTGKLFFLRVKLSAENGQLLALTAGNQHTGFLKTMLQADALVLLPAERMLFKAGEELDAHILNEAFGMLEM